LSRFTELKRKQCSRILQIGFAMIWQRRKVEHRFTQQNREDSIYFSAAQRSFRAVCVRAAIALQQQKSAQGPENKGSFQRRSNSAVFLPLILVSARSFFLNQLDVFLFVSFSLRLQAQHYHIAPASQKKRHYFLSLEKAGEHIHTHPFVDQNQAEKKNTSDPVPAKSYNGKKARDREPRQPPSNQDPTQTHWDHSRRSSFWGEMEGVHLYTHRFTFSGKKEA
jgi:hypothetical protein